MNVINFECAFECAFLTCKFQHTDITISADNLYTMFLEQFILIFTVFLFACSDASINLELAPGRDLAFLAAIRSSSPLSSPDRPFRYNGISQLNGTPAKHKFKQKWEHERWKCKGRPPKKECLLSGIAQISSPPPPLISGNLVLLFRMSKTTYCAYDKNQYRWWWWWWWLTW